MPSRATTDSLPEPTILLRRGGFHAGKDTATGKATSKATDKATSKAAGKATSKTKAVAPDNSPATAELGAASGKGSRAGHGPADQRRVSASTPAEQGGERGGQMNSTYREPVSQAGLRQPLKLPLRTLSRRPAEVLNAAIETFPSCTSWVTFYREILGTEGIVRHYFPTSEQMRYWEASPEFAEVLEMLTALRATEQNKADSTEPQRVITVRIPRSLHETLTLEAEQHQTSINKLCVSKLLNGIANRFVPKEKGSIRGRRPGPQTDQRTQSGERSRVRVSPDANCESNGRQR